MTTTNEKPYTDGLGQTIRLGWMRTGFELRGLLRSKDAVVFTLALPIMFLLLFGAVFGGELEGTGVKVGQWFTPGIIAASILSAGFVNLATSMAVERHDGSLRRLALTPLPTASYVIGKIMITLILAVGMTIALLTIGVLAYGVDLPTTGAQLFTFGWVFVLGVTSAAVMGIALSTIPRNVKAAGVVFTPPFLFLQFVSGVFIDFATIPPWMRAFAGLFPLRWVAAGMRSVFLPPEFEQFGEPGGSYMLGLGATVLIAWTVVGFILAVWTFKSGREQ